MVGGFEYINMVFKDLLVIIENGVIIVDLIEYDLLFLDEFLDFFSVDGF